MTVADDAFAEFLDVSLLLLERAVPLGVRARPVPAIDRPLRGLAAVIVLQRLARQSVTRIARQISGRVFIGHVVPIACRARRSLSLLGSINRDAGKCTFFGR